MKETESAHFENINENKKLVYTQDFKEIIRNNPGLIKSFKKVTRLISELPENEMIIGRVFQEGPLTITVIKDYLNDSGRYGYFKVDANGQSFFLKSEGLSWRGQGHEEFENTKLAKERLKEVKWVEVIEAQLGYQDENGRSFFVSKYLEIPTVEDYMSELDKEDPQYLNLRGKIIQLRKLLPDFDDISAYNMFYDEKRNKIILFDLFTESQDLYKDQDLDEL